LGVSRAGFYKYIRRPESYRSQEDARLGCILKKVHVDNHRAYGCRRLMDALQDQGESIGKSRVKRLMEKHNIIEPVLKL
jgi:putative transposase